MATYESCKFLCFNLPFNIAFLFPSFFVFSHTSFHGTLRRLVIKEAMDNLSIRDSMVVTKDGIFEVFGKESNPWNAYQVQVLPYKPNIGLDLPWVLIGVHM